MSSIFISFVGVGDVSGTTVVFVTSAARLVPARSQLVDQRLARDVTKSVGFYTSVHFLVIFANTRGKST